MRRGDYRPSLGVVFACFPTLARLHLRTAWDNRQRGRFQRGALPPCLLQARYGQSVINRIYNNLPFFDPGFGTAGFPNNPNTTNGGFGRQEPAIHTHNGHAGSENDGAQNAHFFPGQYYDDHYSLMLARRDAGLRDSLGRDLDTLLRIRRGDPRASTPTDDGHVIPLPGDFRESQSTLSCRPPRTTIRGARTTSRTCHW
jgi:hypothetical protein